MEKIDKLTDEQVARLPAIRDEWLAIGLSTEPLDFERAKTAAIELYRLSGLEPPQMFLRFRSPFEAAIAATILKQTDDNQVRDQVEDQVGDQVWHQIWHQVRDQVWDQVWAQVGAQVWHQVEDQVGAQVRHQVRHQVRDQVEDQVRDQVGAQVRDQVWDQVRDQVEDQVRDQVRDQVWGSHDAHWIGFYTTFSEFGAKLDNRLACTAEIARSCGWWAPYSKCVIFQDRPERIQFDDAKRLHCETGPAIRYRDGFSVYAWHGTRVPKEWIEDPSSLDAPQALTVENLEQRRAACEIVGWDRILNELNARTIDADADPEIGTLVEVDIPDVGREKFLRVRCGTGRQFALPVPPEAKTALQANAWTYGIDDWSSFKPEIRT